MTVHWQAAAQKQALQRDALTLLQPPTSGHVVHVVHAPLSPFHALFTGQARSYNKDLQASTSLKRLLLKSVCTVKSQGERLWFAGGFETRSAEKSYIPRSQMSLYSQVPMC